MAEKEKKLAQLNKKYQKEVERLQQNLQAKEEKAMKAIKPKQVLSPFVKILSDKASSAVAASSSSASSTSANS